MAELTTSGYTLKTRAGVAKAKKLSTRVVDLTPMVDLGFLLITFFIFTTTLAEPKAMELKLPDDKGPDMPVFQTGTLTLLPAEDNAVYYYEGTLQTVPLRKTTTQHVREVIMSKKHRTTAEKFYVVIKPTNTSTYKNIVNILDEMTINDVKHYAFADVSAEEDALVKTY